MPPPTIFISFSTDDGEDIAQHVYRHYKEKGYSVFYSPEEIPFGYSWRDEIRKHIEECDIFLLIATRGAINSREVAKEIVEAKRLGKRIIPCRLNNIEWSDLEKFQIDLAQGPEFDSKWELIRKLDAQFATYSEPTGKKPKEEPKRVNRTDKKYQSRSTKGRRRELIIVTTIFLAMLIPILIVSLLVWQAGPHNENEGQYSFLKAWGATGTGTGQFNRSAGIAIDSQGYVYVADTYNYRVQKFFSDGRFVTSWGTEGSGRGQFDNPYGVAIDSQGYVYVIDTGNDRVQKFFSDGRFVTSWGMEGSGRGQFNGPTAIAIDSQGYVYVADTDNNRVQKFFSDGRFVTSWGTYGTSTGQFNWTAGIVIDSQGYVYVTDLRNDRVQKFFSDGRFVTSWGTEGSGRGQFNGSVGIAIDSQGYVYVTSINDGRIQKFDSNGEFITSWGTEGSGRGQLLGPTGIAIDSQGYVYVTEFTNNRVQVWAPRIS